MVFAKPSRAMAETARASEFSEDDERFMRVALEEAEGALARWEVPVGCVVVRDGEVVASGSNRTNEKRNVRIRPACPTPFASPPRRISSYDTHPKLPELSHPSQGTRHAEFEAIDELLARHGGDAVAAGFDRCSLYVTVEPCIMCAGALSLLGFERVTYGCGNDKFGGNGSILSIHDDGCAPCVEEPASSSKSHAGSDGKVSNDDARAANTYPSVGGLFAEEAIRLLQDFYVRGNPKAPKPHRPLAPESAARAGG